MTLHKLPAKCILLVVLLLLLDSSLARSQQFFVAEDVITGTATETGTAAASRTVFGDDQLPINDPSGMC